MCVYVTGDNVAALITKVSASIHIIIGYSVFRMGILRLAPPDPAIIHESDDRQFFKERNWRFCNNMFTLFINWKGKAGFTTIAPLLIWWNYIDFLWRLCIILRPFFFSNCLANTLLCKYFFHFICNTYNIEVKYFRN